LGESGVTFLAGGVPEGDSEDVSVDFDGFLVIAGPDGRLERFVKFLGHEPIVATLKYRQAIEDFPTPDSPRSTNFQASLSSLGSRLRDFINKTDIFNYCLVSIATPLYTGVEE
jgi:hypothetical protein